MGIAQGWWSQEDRLGASPNFPPGDGDRKGDPGYLRSMSEPFGEESERKAPGGGPLSWGDTELKHSLGDPQNTPWSPLPAASWGQNHQFQLSGTEITNSAFPGLKSPIPPFLRLKSPIPHFLGQNPQSHIFWGKIPSSTFLGPKSPIPPFWGKITNPSFPGPKSPIPPFWGQNPQSVVSGLWEEEEGNSWESQIMGVINERKGSASGSSGVKNWAKTHWGCGAAWNDPPPPNLSQGFLVKVELDLLCPSRKSPTQEAFGGSTFFTNPHQYQLRGDKIQEIPGFFFFF